MIKLNAPGLLLLGLMAQESHARFYTGVDVGLNNSQIGSTFYRNLNAPTGPYGEFLTNKNGYNSFVAGIFGGWIYRSGIFSGGIEIGGNVDTLNDRVYKFTSQTDIDESIKATRKGSFDAGIRFGYHPNQQSMVYVKTGVTYAKFKTSWDGTDSSSTPGLTYRDRRSSSRSLAAFKASVGYEAFVSSYIAIRGEMSYTFPISHKINIGRFPSPSYSLDSTQIKFRSSQTTFKLGIAYYF